MKVLQNLLRVLVLICITAGALAVTPSQPVTAAAPQVGENRESVSPQAYLNPDGTLKANGNFNGAFDLEGWDVQLDPALGPVFTPLAATNAWDNVGTGGGAFKDGIYDVLVNGSDIYVGGWFKDAGGNPEADYIAKWDGAQWTSLSSNGSGNGALTSAVSEMALVGSDLYIIGYSFAVLNTSNAVIPNANGLAVWNGSVWSAAPGLSTPLNDWGYALAYDSANNFLYIGGGFTNISGIAEADRIARLNLNTSTWSALGSNGASDGSLGNTVTGIAVDSAGNVYAGGYFTNVNNGGSAIPEADYIAKWDGANWSELGNNGPGVGALNSLLTAVAVDAADNVYVGGNFFNAAGIPTADYIAKWNGSAWSGLGDNGSGGGAISSTGNGAAIQDIVIDGSTIYASGYFTIPTIPTADYIAKFDTGTSAWSNLGSNGAGNGSLNSAGVGMTFSGGSLYVGGYMFDINNNGTVNSTADYFGVWNGSNWGTLGDPNGVFNLDVNAIAVMGTDVYVGGNFRNLGGDPAIDYLAKWNGSTWSAVGNAGKTYGALNGTVYALAVSGSDLYVGGFFTDVYDNVTQNTIPAADYIARWDGANWYALGSGTGGNGSLNGFVQAIAIDGNNIYAGGNFTNVNNNGSPVDAADYLAMFDGATWSAIGTGSGGNGSLGGTVRAIVFNGDLYVGGSFVNVNNNGTVINEADYVAKWDGSDWGALGPGTAIDSHVHALKLVGNDLYIGGQFTNAGGVVNANRIAKYTVNTGAWSAVGNLAALNGTVYSIAELGGNLFVGGTFTNVDGLAEADYIAKFDGTNWSALGSDGSGDGSLDWYVHALSILNNDLLVGGEFTNVNNNGTIVKEADYFAAYGINVPPTDIALSASSVNENLPAGTTVGSFSSTDPNAGDTFTYSLCGGADDASFSITGSALKTAAIFDFETKSSYNICVQTSDGNGGTFQEPFTITVNDTAETVTFNATSTGAQDGWVLESTEASNTGGTINNAATTFRLGDDAAKKQYRGVLSFNTSSLPDNAVITKVTLKLKHHAIVGGGNPINAFQGILVDIKKGMFGTSALQATDFQTAAQKTYGPSKPVLTSGWYSINLTNGKAYINKLTTNGGLTQIRLRFKLDDNNNTIANYLSLFSGNAAAASRPKLIIEYTVP